jgi:hypothetical protein
MVRPLLQVHGHHRLRDPVCDRRHAQQYHAAPARERRDVARRSGRRRELRHAGRAAPGEQDGGEQSARS